MNLNMLFDTQKQLNDRILAEHQLENNDLFAEKQLAFLVELSELANETRCFKYWSKKGPSSKATILEEYVDGLHFVLTLGLSLGYTSFGQPKNKFEERTLTEQFLYVMECSHRLNEKQTDVSFHELAQSFLALGTLLGFEEVEIEQAYFKKNEVNHQRQDQGY